jgi:iron complex outermembrane receptor protein
VTGIAQSIASVNAAGTILKGVNGDAAWLVTRNDRITVNAQYLKASIAFDLADFYLATAGNNLTVLRTLFPNNVYPDDFQRSGDLGRPKWTVNASYAHTFELGGAGSLEAQADLRYLSSPEVATAAPQAAVVANNNLIRLPAHTTFDLSARYRPQEGHWSVNAFVRNLTNKKYLTAKALVSNVPGNPFQIDPSNAASLTPYAFAYLSGLYGEPRTYGVQFRMEFGGR